LGGDLSDFAGIWVNAVGQRALLKPDGVFVLQNPSDGIFYDDNVIAMGFRSDGDIPATGFVFLWNISLPDGYGYGVAFLSVNVNFIINGTVMETDKTKVRLYAGHDLPGSNMELFYYEQPYAEGSFAIESEIKKHNALVAASTGFMMDGSTLVKYIGNETFVTIPEGVTHINEDAFRDKQLTGVIIPGSVISIDSAAFMNNQLTSINFPGSVISIGNWAFHGNKLTNVVIPSSVTSIGYYAFANNPLNAENMCKFCNYDVVVLDPDEIYPGKYHLLADNVFIMSQPDINSEVVRTLRLHDEIEVIESAGGEPRIEDGAKHVWYKVKFKSTEGYIWGGNISTNTYTFDFGNNVSSYFYSRSSGIMHIFRTLNPCHDIFIYINNRRIPTNDFGRKSWSSVVFQPTADNKVLIRFSDSSPTESSTDIYEIDAAGVIKFIENITIREEQDTGPVDSGFQG